MRRTPPVAVQWQPRRLMRAVFACIAALAGAGLATCAVSHRESFWLAWPAWLAVPAATCVWRAAVVLPLARRQLGAQRGALRAALFSAPAAVAQP